MDESTAFDQGAAKFSSWAQANRPEEFSRLTDESSRQNGELYASMCKAYMAAQKK